MDRGQVIGCLVLWILACICFGYGSWILSGTGKSEGVIMIIGMMPVFCYFTWVVIGLLGVE